MSKGLLIAVVLIQLLIAIFTTGTVRSLAELSAFLLISYFVFESKSLAQVASKYKLTERNPR